MDHCTREQISKGMLNSDQVEYLESQEGCAMDAEQRARVARLQEHCAWLLEPPATPGDLGVVADIQAVLGALVTAQVERDRLREDNQELCGRIYRQKDTIDWMHGKVTAADARATHLAALEAAARALVYGGRPVLVGVQAIHEALTALDALPGETRSADARL